MESHESILINSEAVLDENVPANANGRFTLLKIGEYSYKMNCETINSKSWFVRNNENNREYWTPAEYVHGYGNRFRNVYIENNKMYATDVQVIDYTDQYEKKCCIIDEGRKLIEFALHHGRVVNINGKGILETIFITDSLSWKEKYHQLEAEYNSLKLNEDFDSFMKLFIPECAVNIESLPYGLYYASIEDNEMECYSYNRELVASWMKKVIAELASSKVYTLEDFDTNLE